MYRQGNEYILSIWLQTLQLEARSRIVQSSTKKIPFSSMTEPDDTFWYLNLYYRNKQTSAKTRCPARGPGLRNAKKWQKSQQKLEEECYRG